jgi:hypothetical protein
MMNESYHSALSTLHQRLMLGTISKEQYLNRAIELQNAEFEKMEQESK